MEQQFFTDYEVGTIIHTSNHSVQLIAIYYDTEIYLKYRLLPKTEKGRGRIYRVSLAQYNELQNQGFGLEYILNLPD